MRRIDYNQRQHTVYARGRELSPDVVESWMRIFASHCRPERPLSVLDLGCGIGRFTPALADTFGGPVYGVEPSLEMRRIAQHRADHAGVSYLDGSAEHIPLPDHSCDVVLMFLVLHHVPGKARAAAEIARVLRPGGRVFVRSTFSDRIPDLRWHRYFPRVVEIERQVFPTVAGVVELFSRAGVEHRALQTVPMRLAGSLAEHAERLRLRAISTFEHLTEEETEQGFAALDADVARETTPSPVDTTGDLLVLGT